MIDFSAVVLYFLRIPKAYYAGMKCTSPSAPDTSETKRILFIGNSPNLLTQDKDSVVSWEGIMGELEGILPSEWRCSEEENYPIPLSVRAERMENYAKESSEANAQVSAAWSKWYTKVAELAPASFIHRLIASHASLFDCILTTNYDYALEKCLNPDFMPHVRTENDEIAANLTRHHDKVWHIHGEAGALSSIVMLRKKYLDAAKHVCDDESNDSWLSRFLQSEVHVCGFTPGQEELLFWYALARRMELPRNQRRKVVVYLFYRPDKDMAECEVLRTLLRTYDVKPVAIQVPKKGNVDDYEDAWKTVVGHILLDCSSPVTVGKHKRSRSTDLNIPAKSNVVLPVVGRKEYLVKSTTPTLQNPLRCWMNIRLEKLEKAVAEESAYFFSCRIEDEQFNYYCPSVELRKAFIERAVSVMKTPNRYSFYLDYRTGEIFSTISPNASSSVITLNRV